MYFHFQLRLFSLSVFEMLNNFFFNNTVSMTEMMNEKL